MVAKKDVKSLFDFMYAYSDGYFLRRKRNELFARVGA